MTQPTLSVANYLVGKSLDTGASLTPMKLIKLVFIAHGWHLALYDDPLIADAVEAWKYGPVVPEVYQVFRHFKGDQITKQQSLFSSGKYFVPNVQDEEARLLLDQIWTLYGKLSGLQLSALTHKKGSPWDTVWNEHGGSATLGAVIPNDIIRDYYRGIAERGSAQA
jgi:uncharacterized phage-associated protein